MGNRNRNGGLDLLRVLCMALIILFHLVKYGVGVENMADTAHGVYAGFFYGLDKILTTVFFFTSFYFLSENTHLRLGKVISFLIEAIFFSLIFGLIGLATRFFEPTPMFFLNLFFPVSTVVWWFVTTYLVMYLLSPLWNWVIAKINLWIHLAVIVVVLALWIVLPLVGALSEDYTLVFRMLMLYFLAALLRKYAPKLQINFFVGLAICIVTYVMAFSIYFFVNGQGFVGFYAILRANNPLQIVMALALFYAFKDIRVDSRIVLPLLYQANFTVYLVHDHPFLRDLLWKRVFDLSFFTQPIFPLYAIAFTIGVYVFCFLCFLAYRYSVALLLKKPLALLNERWLSKADAFLNRPYLDKAQEKEA